MIILFLAESVSLAHITRPLQLAKIAHQNGHEGHFACHPENLKKAEKEPQPFAIHPISSIHSQKFYERILNSQFPYTLEELQTYLAEDIALIQKIKPDVIVGDYRLTSYIAGKLTNTPVIQLLNLHWSPYINCPFLPSPSSMAGLFGKTLFNLLRPAAFRLYGAPYRRLLKQMHLPAIKDFREIYTLGDYAVYMDIPDIAKQYRLPQNHRIIGYVPWKPTTLKEEKLGIFPKENNIYITLGSTGNEQTMLPILQVLERTNRFLFISGITSSFKEKLLLKFPFLKNRSVLKDFLDPETILHTCDLTICHGGSGTAYQSLIKKVPVLCFPSHPDQQLVAYYTHQLGVGEYLYSKKISHKAIHQVLHKMLSSTQYKEQASILANKILACDTANNWLNLLSEIEEQHTSIPKVKNNSAKDLNVALALQTAMPCILTAVSIFAI